MEPVVYLVGAGPGDPKLLTIRAKEVIESGRVILYDRLVNPRILEYAPRFAELIYVGKRCGDGNSRNQKAINNLLLTHARKGGPVVRLKGGDPLIFGRGGEEMVALSDAGIAYEVVPGITAASAAAAQSCFPLTHRGISSGVAFFSGQSAENGTEDIDWSVAARIPTVVFYMGASRLNHVAKEMIRAGRAPEDFLAVIERASLPDNEVTVISLGKATTTDSKQFGSPALIVIGQTIGLRAILAFGKGDSAAPNLLHTIEQGIYG